MVETASGGERHDVSTDLTLQELDLLEAVADHGDWTTAFRASRLSRFGRDTSRCVLEGLTKSGYAKRIERRNTYHYRPTVDGVATLEIHDRY